MNSAKAYAIAFLEICKENNSDIDTIISELKLVYGYFDKDVVKFLSSPKVNKEDKKSFLSNSFKKIQKVTDSFLKVLVDNSNVTMLNEIITEMINIIDDEKGIITIEVITVNELDAIQKDLIQTYFNNKLNKIIKIKESINPNLVGGLIIKYEGKIIDGSLFNKHESLKEYLKK